MAGYCRFFLTVGSLGLVLLLSGSLLGVILAQEATIVVDGAAQPAQTSPQPMPSKRGPEGRPQGQPAPGEQGKPAEGEAPNGEKKSGEKKNGDEKKKDGEDSPTVTRPMAPPQAADPKELEVRPDEQGRVSFNFRGQPWPAVLEWYAEISGMSLDWQELPGDFLNLSTQRAYTLDEVHDLINRHLLARGFTMLHQGEFLTVVKIEKINPGMVPRIAPEELADRMPYEFAKTSFELQWLIAPDLAKELEPMLSPNGKLTALTHTNRIEAMDAVTNLRQIYRIIQQEESPESRDVLVREFQLHFTRAEDVKEQLQEMLGEKQQQPGPMTPEQMQQMQQMRMQMQQQQQQQGGQPPGQPKKEASVSLVANARMNSLLVHAPPDKMAVVAAAVRLIDVPSGQQRTLQAMTTRMRIFRLASLDPEQLMNTLTQMGGLDPTTRLQVDKKNNALILYGTLADQMTVQALVDRLDGTSRKFHVVQLRRLPADEVAGTIEFMMVGKEKDENQNRRPYYFDYFGSRNQQQEEKNPDKFRVSANLTSNQLLLWANEIEVEEVRNLLVQLGEISLGDSNRGLIRTLEIPPGPEQQEFLERLRKAWPSLAPNELQLPGSATEAPAAETKDNTPTSTKPTEDVRETRAGFPSFHFAQLEQPVRDQDADSSLPVDDAAALPDDEPGFSRSAAAAPSTAPGTSVDLDATLRPDAAERTEQSPPPVRISVGPDGQLIVSSRDTQALNLVEELVGQLMPPPKDYHIFPLKYADAYWVSLNLEDFFEEKENENENSFRPYWYYYDNQPSPSDTTRLLSKRRPLKFISDTDTNSILVQGATSEQLRTIEELIKFYDTPQPPNTQLARVTRVFYVRHSRAQVVAEAVKDVFRDLLSSNDKALQQQQQNGNNGRTVIERTYLSGFGGETGDSSNRTQVSFKGKLSIGVDELSNTLIVSTEGDNLMKLVEQLIQSLDEAARPNTSVEIVRLSGAVNAEHVKEALAELFSQKQAAPGQGQPGQQQPGQNPQQQQQNGQSQQNQAAVEAVLD